MNSPAIAARLNAQRVESPLSGERVLGWTIAACVAGLIGWGGMRLVDPTTLPIRQVQVTGDFVNLSPVALRETASDVVRGGFFSVNVEDIRNTLIADPWVRSVTVKRIWPDTLKVSVREQEAVTAWGSAALLNSDGEVFRPHPDSIPADLPRLYGPDGSQQLVLQRYLTVSEILEGAAWELESLELNDRRSWSLRLRSGPVVVIGRNNVGDRLERFLTVAMEQFGSRLHEAESVDMRYTNGFAVRWSERELNEVTVGRRVNGKEN